MQKFTVINEEKGLEEDFLCQKKAEKHRKKNGGVIEIREFTPPVDTSYIRFRRGGYAPVGDQLDAIWKQFAFMREQGLPLHPETEAMLDRVLENKDAFQKGVNHIEK